MSDISNANKNCLFRDVLGRKLARKNEMPGDCFLEAPMTWTTLSRRSDNPFKV